MTSADAARQQLDALSFVCPKHEDLSLSLCVEHGCDVARRVARLFVPSAMDAIVVAEFDRAGLLASTHFADDSGREWPQGYTAKAEALAIFDAHPALEADFRQIAKGFLWTLPSDRPIRDALPVLNAETLASGRRNELPREHPLATKLYRKFKPGSATLTKDEAWAIANELDRLHAIELEARP
jgi:hypothetical protein